MAFLSIGGATIPVEYPGAVAENTETVGDFGRAFSGNPMSSTRAIKNVWRVNTQWMSPAVYDAVRAAVNDVLRLVPERRKRLSCNEVEWSEVLLVHQVPRMAAGAIVVSS